MSDQVEAALWASMPQEVQDLKAEHDRLVAVRRSDPSDEDARGALKSVNAQLREAAQTFREIGEFLGTRTPLMVSVDEGI
jgi:hypothetical protein